ncbi:Uncharacterised protein [Mycobacteroides abscessus]|nr:Uncharacterised protein [Mycobacteroides abscessus]
MFGPETPMKTSAPARPSRSVPVKPSGLVVSARRRRCSSVRLAPGWIAPWRSNATMLPAPWPWSSAMIALPAAPTPETTMRTSSMALPTTRSAFVSAASTTIAVPCWSSWNTGMSSSSRRRRSISKQRGAEMSSRLIPPYTGAMAFTVRMISSVSVVSRHTGQASTPANCLNSAALPSMTGRAAAGPMSPRPRTAVPSVTTATVLRLTVRRRASSGRSAMARHTRATPGV